MKIVSIAICFLVLPVFGEDTSALGFEAYLAKVRIEAEVRGISRETLDIAFKDLQPDPRVIAFDRRQPEFVQTFDQYLTQRLSKERVRQAREQYIANRAALEEIAEVYDVDAEYLVAFWGLESSFGKYQGKYDIVRSLATLGHDARRSRFFTEELHAALQILDEGHVSKEMFVGGWAGAMGQNQFLPSTFLNYAADYDRDGRKDIWTNKKDIWASIANYLRRNGWRKNAGWGMVVAVPENFVVPIAEEVAEGCRALRSHSAKLTIRQWASRRIDVGDAESQEVYALILPEEGDTTSYLVGGNFRSILSYNCANKYAVSVGLLAELIVPPVPPASS